MSRVALKFSLLFLVLGMTASRANSQGIPGMIAPGAGMAAGMPPGSNPTGMGAGGLGGVYGNSYANPLLNPYMMMMQPNVGRTNALLYLWGAQQSPGGLLANPVANSRTRTTSAANKAAPRPSMRPGGQAAYFYSRGPVAAGTSRSYFQRYNRYYGR